MYAIANFLISLLDYKRPPLLGSNPFPDTRYSALWGNYNQVNRPGTVLKTNFPSDVPFLKQLNGNIEKHPISMPGYQQAYETRQRKSMYTNNPRHKLDIYQYPTIQEKRLRYLDGTTVSSRDHVVKPDTFHEKCKSFKRPNSGNIILQVR